VSRRIALAVLIALLTVLSACGSTSTGAPTSAPAATSIPAATSAPEATAAPAATSAPDATTAPAATSAPDAAATSAPAATAATGGSGAAGTRTFVIVPDQSEATYQVQETFLKQNTPFSPIGKTSTLEGVFQFTTAGKPTGQVTGFKVDLRTLKTDNERRDNAIKENWLESNKYPFAEFVSTGVEGVPDSYTEGQEVSFKLLGNMTIRNITKPVTFDVKGKLSGDTVTGTATSEITMKDFGFEPPTIAGMISVQDGVKLAITFTAKEQK
jgi:polyisoprenoid-binding protein YceI